MRNDRENIIVTRAIEFSLLLIKYCEQLEQDKKYIIARQLLRSGTSMGANIHEAQNAESKIDFIHKMNIAAKEASESSYWLLLCERSELYRFDSALRDQLDEITKILSSSKSNSN